MKYYILVWVTSKIKAPSLELPCTHPILSGKAYERLNQSAIVELLVANTLEKDHQSNKVKVIEIAGLFADTITCVHSNKSISSNFIC